MTTKMFLKNGKLLLVQANVLLETCQRCVAFCHQSLHKPVCKRQDNYCSVRQSTRTLTGSALKIYPVFSLRVEKISLIENISKRWFSKGNDGKDSNIAEQNTDDESSRSRNTPSEDSKSHQNSNGFLDPSSQMSGKPDVLSQLVRSNDSSADESLTNGQPSDVIDSTTNDLNITEPSKFDLALEDPFDVDILAEQPSPIVLEEFVPPLLPSESLTLASYVEHSPTLQKLVELGVDLSKVEKRAKIGNALIKMDFEKDVKDKVVLLHQAGVSGEALGRLLTINPFVLTEDLVDLETRLRYLRTKMFSEDAIKQVLMRAPYFISFSVERVDSKLGFYQKELNLTGDEVRHIITLAPKLVTFKIQRVKENMFVFRQQLGFTPAELKKLVLTEPRLLLRGKEKVIGTFDYLHNHMGIPHKQLVKNPQAFNGRVFKLQERHQFLEKRGLAQYDPTQPGYIPLEQISKLPDNVFCQDIAKSSVEDYNSFLKTL